MTISIADLCFQTKKIISEFGCKTKYLTFREEHRMTVMKVRALRRACGRNRENIEKYKLLSFTTCAPSAGIRIIISGRVKLIRHVAHMNEKRNAYRV